MHHSESIVPIVGDNRVFREVPELTLSAGRCAMRYENLRLKDAGKTLAGTCMETGIT